jgi:outer membrane protein TolC
MIAPWILLSLTSVQEPLPRPRESAAPYAPATSVLNHANESAEPHPIDLATAIRLADSNSPLNLIALARLRAAVARQELADLMFVPNFSIGPGYFRHDGVDQNRRGDVFQVTRSQLYTLGGPSLRVDTAEAIFEPLVRRQQTGAFRETARAVRNKTQLAAAAGYFDLLQVHGRLAVNAEVIHRVNQMLEKAKIADKTGLSKTKGDVNRAMTELFVRKQERIDLEGLAGAMAARLAKVLLLPPDTLLVPDELRFIPLTVVPRERTMEDLLALAIGNRPELAASRFMAGSAREQLRFAKNQPLIPRMQLDYAGGVFGAGKNSFIGDTALREDILLQANWELKNFGFGNAAMIRERRAQLDGSLAEVTEMQAQITAEVTEAARIAGARFATLEAAQKAVGEVEELYRKLLASSFGMVGPRETYDALEPLLAIQEINRVRNLYITEVTEFNKAQFTLYMAIGQPPLEALDTAEFTELAVPPIQPKQ